MVAPQTQILQRLAVLVVCHGLATGQVSSHYVLVQRPMSWVKAREFCQRHYVDLAVLSSEEQYFSFLNDNSARTTSFWLGLRRKDSSRVWKWVDGEELSYEHWYRINYEGRCASLEAMLKNGKKLLARYCDEPHMILCQGPISPQSVAVDSVGEQHVSLSWNVSAFMQMTPHSYNVTVCSSTCRSLLYTYTGDSALMHINISNLTSATEYFIQVSTFVVRPDGVSSGKRTLQSKPLILKVKTVESWQPYIVAIISLNSLKLVFLAPTLWIIYRTLKKDADSEKDNCFRHQI
ncbi:uncharacterized protein LOC114442003 [Parambassis ranga]|uniref:Uncharacterized protein LOC114442003 n=1 Tax=Parambassis ranga TaxID=210632 RepID=A0A6P7J3G0_9TELE|nr:uncharacterized protein LOC114442003 [Parambassis ranga]